MAAVGWGVDGEDNERQLSDLFRCFNLRKAETATCHFISYPVNFTTFCNLSIK